MTSLGFKSQRQKESVTRDVVAILAALVQRSRRSRGTAGSRGRADIGREHRADHDNVSPDLAVERRDPPVGLRASVADRRTSPGVILVPRSADLPGLKSVLDVRLGGAGAKLHAQGVMRDEVFSVILGLAASQQRAERDDDRALRVHALPMMPATQSGWRR